MLSLKAVTFLLEKDFTTLYLSHNPIYDLLCVLGYWESINKCS